MISYIRWPEIVRLRKRRGEGRLSHISRRTSDRATPSERSDTSSQGDDNSNVFTCPTTQAGEKENNSRTATFT